MSISEEKDETSRWLRHFFYFCLLAAAFHLFQTISGVLLWIGATSPILLVFGLDALVGAARELVLASRIARHAAGNASLDSGSGLFVVAAWGYLGVGAMAVVLGSVFLLQTRQPAPSLLGVGLAALSMLAIPIIGSYMKSLAMELRSRPLKAAAVFTFGNSYLAMVLLIGLLVNAGMQHWWSDPLGAIVMCPFIVQKGVQMLTEERSEFVEN